MPHGLGAILFIWGMLGDPSTDFTAHYSGFNHTPLPLIFSTPLRLPIPLFAPPLIMTRPSVNAWRALHFTIGTARCQTGDIACLGYLTGRCQTGDITCLGYLTGRASLDCSRSTQGPQNKVSLVKNKRIVSGERCALGVFLKCPRGCLDLPRFPRLVRLITPRDCWHWTTSQRESTVFQVQDLNELKVI
ncbi:hypothetical protein RRG08_019123 [Elysia crispata]|uniref:Secreted protein n=1 Tax=Elysia crispata TaxID=231223 RepID=A0AAE1B1P6_9GAST|nr:hypothetical protein RRG08_019123 [Elysia crispata]